MADNGYKGNYKETLFDTSVEKSIARCFVLIRENRGWTQSDLAKKLGVGKSTICGYERGIRTPNFDTIIKLSKIANVPLDSLIKAATGSSSSDAERTLEEEILLTIFNDTSAINRKYIIEAARGIAKVGMIDEPRTKHKECDIEG